MLTNEKSVQIPHGIKPRKKRWLEWRRKERGWLIYRLLEHLYGEQQASCMWSAYLQSKQYNGGAWQVQPD